MTLRSVLFFLVVFLPISTFSQATETKSPHYYEADIVIYGGTSSAVIAAVKAASLNRKVLLVSPDKHLGGMSSHGLGFTDSGHKDLVGGLANEFYAKIYDHYKDEAAWNIVSKEEFGNKGQGTPAMDEHTQTMWTFEPHVAEKVFTDWVNHPNITVLADEWLDRNRPLHINGKEIKGFYTLSGKLMKGKIFIDATYEGDLMAAAGVSFTVGRESNEVYNENYNGIQQGVFMHHHNFKHLKVDPYVVENKPNSGVLPKISTGSIGKNGEGDYKLEAYCYRLCLTKIEDNKIPITKPDGYNKDDYELLGRIYKKGWDETFHKFDEIPNGKTDVNNHGPFSHDNIGMNYDYPTATYERRKEILEEHKRYQQGLMYFTMTDPRVPEKIRQEMSQWGYAKDEFTDNGGFPSQIYVREARRMVGDYVMTELDVMGKRETPESIGMGSYNLDSHNVQRYITKSGHVQNEGDIGVKPPHPYTIAKGSILPKESECTNLIVPVCVSSSHIAFGSIRMEPVFMILGESAAQIADLSIKNKTSVQNVNYSELKNKLEEAGQILQNNRN